MPRLGLTNSLGRCDSCFPHYAAQSFVLLMQNEFHLVPIYIYIYIYFLSPAELRVKMTYGYQKLSGFERRFPHVLEFESPAKPNSDDF